MRAVNLLPDDDRGRRGSGTGGLRGPANLIVGVLGLALALVTVYVVTTNSVNGEKSKLTTLQQQVPQVATVHLRPAAGAVVLLGHVHGAV